jgi:hypothetical protein
LLDQPMEDLADVLRLPPVEAEGELVEAACGQLRRQVLSDPHVQDNPAGSDGQ